MRLLSIRIKPASILITITACLLFSSSFAPAQEKPLLLQPDLHIDLENLHPEMILSTVSYFDFAPDGSLYILDSKAKMLFKLDRDFKFSNSVGRPGQGPGELNSVTSFCINTNGEICVLNSPALQVFSPEGKALRQHQLEPRSMPNNIYSRPGGGLVFSLASMRPKDKGMEFYQEVISADQDFKELKTLYRQSSEDGQHRGHYTFVAQPEGGFFVRHISTEVYEIEHYNAEGKLLGLIKRPFKAVKKSPARVAREKENMDKQMARYGIKREFTPDPYKNSISRLLTDESGRLWVLTIGSEPEDERLHLDLFNAAGLFRARFVLPDEFISPVLKLRRNAVWVLDAHSDEGAFLARYPLPDKLQ